jgi:hypothetical protein
MSSPDPRVEENRAAIAASVPYVAPQPKIIRPVPIVLDKPRTMVMDFKAMKLFHNLTGLSPWAREVWSDPIPDVMAALLYSALSHEDPLLTLEDVESMEGLSMGNIAYLSDRLGELWGETMPEADQEAAKEEGTAPNLPQEPSTSNGRSTGRSAKST